MRCEVMTYWAGFQQIHFSLWLTCRHPTSHTKTCVWPSTCCLVLKLNWSQSGKLESLPFHLTCSHYRYICRFVAGAEAEIRRCVLDCMPFGLNDKEKQQILTFRRLKPATVWHFCLKMTENNEWIIKIVSDRSFKLHFDHFGDKEDTADTLNTVWNDKHEQGNNERGKILTETHTASMCVRCCVTGARRGLP